MARVSLLSTLAVLGRRWVVLGIGLALCGTLCWSVLHRVGSDYQASGQLVLLLPPDASGVETPSNPYVNLQPDLNTVASVVASSAMTSDTEHRLADEGFTAEYDVAVNPGTGPLLLITTMDEDPALAVATRDAVLRSVTADLAAMQVAADVPDRQLISATPSGVTVGAEVLPGSRLRALAGTATASLLLLLLVVFALDRLLERRVRSRAVADARPVDDGRVDVMVS